MPIANHALAQEPQESRRPEFIHYLIGFSLLVATSVCSYFLATLYTNEAIESELKSQLNQSEQNARNYLRNAESQINFLTQLPPISGIVRATHNAGVDALDSTNLEQWKRRLEIIFTEYIRTHKDVRQVRFISVQNNGLELVRVHSNGLNIEVVPKEMLQTKADRKYFKNALNTKADSIYYSDIDLNREWGEIERPIWPTFRIVKGVYDENDNPFGFVIINYNAKYFLDLLKTSMNTGTSYVVNQNGGFLIHPDPNYEFEFEFDPTKNWHTFTGEDLPDINSEVVLMHKTQDEFIHYAATSLHFGGPDSNHSIYIVSAITHSNYLKRISSQIIYTFIVIAILTLSALTFAFLLNKEQSKVLKYRVLSQRLAKILEATGELILVLDRRGLIRYCSPAAETKLDIGPSPYHQHSFIEKNIPPQFKAEFIDFVQQTFVDISVTPFKFNYIGNRGSALTVNVIETIILDDDLGREMVALILKE